jgi:hypothetical protein
LREQLINARPDQIAQVRDLLDLFQRSVSARKRNGENGETTSLLASLAAMVNMTPEEVEKIVNGVYVGYSKLVRPGLTADSLPAADVASFEEALDRISFSMRPD